MAKQNVAEQFVDILARAGVKRLYGVVGDSLNPVVDAIRRNSAIDWIHVRHEETAAFAAGAEAQITGRLTACAGFLRPRQPPSHQRSVRRPPLHGPGPRPRLADPLQRDRPRLLPGDPSRPALQRVQPLQRADLQPEADAQAAADRHPARDRPVGGQCRVAPRRHRRRSRPGEDRRDRPRHLPAERPPRRRRDRQARRADRRGRPGHPLLRQRDGGGAHRGHGVRGEDQVTGGTRAARQGVDSVRQPVRRRHERSARLRRGLRGHARVRPAHPPRHRLPLQRLPPGRREDRPGRRPPRTPGPAARSWTWRSGATSRRPCAVSPRGCAPRATAASWTRC